MLRLYEIYQKQIVPQLLKELNLSSVMEVPKILKVSINMGVGSGARDKKSIYSAVADLEKICGQKAVITKVRKSIAGFKIRDGMPIGCKVTLRKQKMYEFLDRFISIAIPRIRDFRGFSNKSFDGKGNYSVGIKEQIIFPEIDYDKIDVIRGMDVSIITSAVNDKQSFALLKAFNFPIKDLKNKK